MDAANSTPSTSKVIIQCTDSDNILQQFETIFLPRTPLRNLHWKSPTRPLRSIPSLNVTLVRKDPSQNGTQSGARRHQIPGLRETPYLKIYLLRCDDKESYKESVRKEIKQWIKENTLEKESKSSLRNQEHHDAYEWMVVHVVLPNTPAASQPRSSKHITLEATESTDSVNSKSKWTGKSSSTIFDKLRADFSSSKSSIPRVAQVRITEHGKPTVGISPADIEEQWQDLVDNFKAAILSSFDTRVSQYEEDIRERENQRSLPGWNFCTFFVLKEGLGRGFENVGLLDDALAVYSELEIGLDLVLKENSDQDIGEGAGALLPYARDMKSVIRKALDQASQNSLPETNGHSLSSTLRQILDADHKHYAFETDTHNYRDLILKNQVSALDLRIYMFARKMELWIRQSGLNQPLKTQGKAGQVDLNTLADLGEFALDFINLAVREYRVDLHAAWGGRLSGSERAMQKVVIGNIVASWAWSAISQVLDGLLRVVDADILPQTETTDTLLNGVLSVKSDEDLGKRPMSQDRRNSSSLHTSPSRGVRSQSLPRLASISKESLDVPSQRIQAVKRPGLDLLFTWTARLFLLARSVLEGVPAALPWSDPLRKIELPGSQQHKMRLHRHSSHGTDSILNNAQFENQHLCLDSSVLRLATSSVNSFIDLYQLLSVCASCLFNHAGQERALNQVLVEIAGQAHITGNKTQAVQCLSRVLDTALRDGSAGNATFATTLYAECLVAADRPNEYAQCLLACLQSAPAQQSIEVAQGYFDQLVKIAALVDPVEIPLAAILSIQDVDKAISHSEHRDCFSVSLRYSSKFDARLTADESLKLHVSSRDDHEPQDFWLSGPKDVKLNTGLGRLSFSSHTDTLGWYTFTRLEMRIGNLSFVHHFGQGLNGPNKIRPRYEAPSVMVYPRSDGLDIDMTPTTTIVLGAPRMLSAVLRPGIFGISQCSIRLRSASAGLRLHLHDSVSASPVEVVNKEGGTLLNLTELSLDEEVTIEVPYTLESGSDSSITIRCQVQYEVGRELFTLYKTCNVDAVLPISVNVQDIHRDSHWFSKFLIRPARLVPIVFWGCSIDDDSETTIEGETDLNEPVIVFPQQPAIWAVRISHQGPRSNAQMKLNLRYQCLDELVLNILKRHFESVIGTSPVKHACSLLSSHLLETVRNGWTEQDLEVAGLTRELEVWGIKDLDWTTILCAFDQSMKDDVRARIEEWHSRTKTIPIELDEAPVRTLKLSVDIPKRPPVVKTGIQVKSGDISVSLGQPILCQVGFIVALDRAESEGQEFEFSFELFAPSEAWLIGGRKKGVIDGQAAKTEIQTILFPQRSGVLLLPMIDVRCRKRNEAKSKANKEWVEVPIEVYNTTLSKSLQVTPSLQSATIGLTGEEGNPMSSGAVISSKSR